MALRKYKPTNAGTRWRIGNAYAEITTNVPVSYTHLDVYKRQVLYQATTVLFF